MEMIEVCDNLHRLRMYRKKVLNISIGNFHRNQIAYNLQALPLSESHSISHHYHMVHIRHRTV